jgi:hypothetical protein
MNCWRLLLPLVCAACAGVQHSSSPASAAFRNGGQIAVHRSRAVVAFATPPLGVWSLSGPPARPDDHRPRYWWEAWIYPPHGMPRGIGVVIPARPDMPASMGDLPALLANARIVTLDASDGMSTLETVLPGIKAHAHGGIVEVVLDDSTLVTRLFAGQTSAQFRFVDRDDYSHDIQRYGPIVYR